MAVLLTAGAAGPASGDVLTLKSGGKIGGRITSPPGSPVIVIESLVGSTYEFDRGEVIALSRRPVAIEQYEAAALKADATGTADAHLELARWCRSRRLGDRATEQFAKVIAIDPDNRIARVALGHEMIDGEWHDPDERRIRRGLVRVGDRWMPREAKAEQDRREQERVSSREWFERLQPVLRAINGFNRDRRNEAINMVARVDDAAAVRALQTLFASHPSQEVRLAVIDAFGAIGGVETVRPLALLAVHDIDEYVRIEAAKSLDPNHATDSVRELVRSLRSENNAEVRNAAVALRHVGDGHAVPHLIEALVTSHVVVLRVPDRSPAFSVGGGQIGMANGSTLPPEIEAALRTGQLPAGYHLPEPRTVAKKVRRSVQNQAVLSTLQQMTGQSFGYDRPQWLAWYREHQKANAGK